MSIEYPAGAICNGREFIHRLETHHKFECEGGPLRLCADWEELKRCFEYLAIYAASAARTAMNDSSTSREAFDLWHPACRRNFRYYMFKRKSWKHWYWWKLVISDTWNQVCSRRTAQHERD